MSEEPVPAGDDRATLADNYRTIRERIDGACARAGRAAGEITLIGVTKTKPASMIRDAASLGIADVGENYVQEIVAKHEEIGDVVRWHFIGHLQRNKVRLIAPFVAMIHGVDSERLGVAIDKEAAAIGRRIPVLLQVNTSGEESKFGVEPEGALDLAAALGRLDHIELEGLMTIGAFPDDPEDVRPMFRLLRELRDSIGPRLGIPLRQLSMGMTSDFEVAIEEGSTMVRIGTALFGGRV